MDRTQDSGSCNRGSTPLGGKYNLSILEQSESSVFALFEPFF